MLYRKILMAMIAVLIVTGGIAQATPKWVEAIPSCDKNGLVTIPDMPAGATLLNVEVYDDIRGIPGQSLGAVHQFKLEPGQGFNFTWKDKDGTWWQMITPKSASLLKGLIVDCIDDECKYLRPMKTAR
jgi:uncharacterized cupredoxin-like copper-binding protein